MCMYRMFRARLRPWCWQVKHSGIGNFREWVVSSIQEINIASYLELDIAAGQGPEPADTLCANAEVLATYWGVLDKKRIYGLQGLGEIVTLPEQRVR